MNSRCVGVVLGIIALGIAGCATSGPPDPAPALVDYRDDPIRHNPATSAAHARDVDQVRRLLYTAKGYYDQGRFNEAIATWEQVLAIDPNNGSAIRGIKNAKNAAHNSRNL